VTAHLVDLVARLARGWQPWSLAHLAPFAAWPTEKNGY